MKRASLLLLIILLSGCSLLKFPELNAPKPPETIYGYDETSKVVPTSVVADGKVYVVEQRERTISVDYAKRDKKLSFMQRLGNWVSGWGFLAIALVIVGLFVAPAATIGFLLNRVKNVKKALSETVKGIEEYKKTTEESDALTTALSKSQDIESKKLIDDIRRS